MDGPNSPGHFSGQDQNFVQNSNLSVFSLWNHLDRGRQLWSRMDAQFIDICQFNCFGHKPVLFQYFEQSQQGP